MDKPNRIPNAMAICLALGLGVHENSPKFDFDIGEMSFTKETEDEDGNPITETYSMKL